MYAEDHARHGSLRKRCERLPVEHRTRVTVVAVNSDLDMYHTWTLSTNGPPYGSMPMMGSGGMMGSGSMMGTSMLGPASATGFWSQQFSFTASAGTYWYLCEVTGHASDGMYGGFVVP